MKCLYCLNCPKYGQLIIRKIIRIRIIATRCVSDFGVKMYKILFRMGLRPRPYLGSLQRSFVGGAYSASLTLWLLRVVLLREGKGRESKRKRKWASKKGVWAPQSSPQIDAAVANSVSTTRRTGVNQKQGSQQYNWLASAEPATKSNATSYQLGTTVITWHVIAKWADRPIQTEYKHTEPRLPALQWNASNVTATLATCKKQQRIARRQNIFHM